MSDISLPLSSAYLEAQLTALQLQEKTGLSLRELAEMDLSEYAGLAYGQTPAQAAIEAYNRQQDAAQPPPNVTGREAADFAPSPDGPQGIDLNSIDWSKVDPATYAELRQTLGIDVASAEGMSRASLSMESRMVRQRDFGPSGRIQFGRWSG
jgi:hypothetical protein